MNLHLAAQDDKTTKAERGDRLEEQLAFKSRYVLVFGEITDTLALATCRRLLALSEESDAPITMLISSPGGHVESGDAIHDMINFVRAPITTVGTGYCPGETQAEAYARCGPALVTPVKSLKNLREFTLGYTYSCVSNGDGSLSRDVFKKDNLYFSS